MPGAARRLLLITHDPAFAGRCERQLRLADGRIAEDRRVAAAAVGRDAARPSACNSASPFRLARRELRGGTHGFRRLSRLPGARGRRDRRGRLACRRGRPPASRADARSLLGGDVERAARLPPGRRRGARDSSTAAARSPRSPTLRAMARSLDGDGAALDRAQGGRCGLSALRRNRRCTPASRPCARARPAGTARSARLPTAPWRAGSGWISATGSTSAKASCELRAADRARARRRVRAASILGPRVMIAVDGLRRNRADPGRVR